MSDPKKEVKLRQRFLFIAALAVIAIVGAGTAVFEGVRAYRIWSASEHLPAKLELPQPGPLELPPDHLRLNTIPMRQADKRRLLDGNFTIVLRVSDLTQACRDSFTSSFVSLPWSPASKEPPVQMADPGQDFNATDLTREGLPFRRLIFAGIGSRTCFIYYERRTGLAPPHACLTVMDYEQGKVIWVGADGDKVSSLKALRRIFVAGFFADTYGSIC